MRKKVPYEDPTHRSETRVRLQSEIGPDGNIFGSRSGLTDLAGRAPNILPSGSPPQSIRKYYYTSIGL